MKLLNILDEWDKDVTTDVNGLDTAALDIARLHAKYLRYLTGEKMFLKTQQIQYDTLLANKKSWALGEMSQVQLEHLGWKPWLEATPLKSQVDDVLKSDQEIQALSLTLELASTRVFALENILKLLHNRSFQLNVALGALKFKNGE